MTGLAAVATDRRPRLSVLYVIDSLAPGGAETSLAEMAKDLVRSGVRVHVAYFGARTDLASRFVGAGAELWPLHVRDSRVARSLAVRRLCRALKPDLVHTTLFEADIAGRSGAWLARVPVVSSIVNEMYGDAQRGPENRRFRLGAARLADVTTARAARRFHAISKTVAESMAPRLCIDRRKIDVIVRGRDPEHLGERSQRRRDNTRMGLHLSDATPVVLAVARVEPQKGLDVLVLAAHILRADFPHLKVLVAGRPGRQSASIEASIERLGLDEVFNFLGARDDVADLLCAADVLAFPSRWEGLGGTLIEALALECPIVASDLPVVREVLGEGTSARLVTVGDSEHLASALAESLRAGRDQHALTAGRQRFLDRYTTSLCANSMIQFYEDVLR